MKYEYIEKNKRKKILLLCDDITATSGIAEWTERYTTPGHPIGTVARAALAKATGENND